MTETAQSKGTIDRLLRKRQAARVRQQRCRARKRQILLEGRRTKDEAKTMKAIDSAHHARPSTHSIPLEQPSSVMTCCNDIVPAEKPFSELSNTVSFDSQRSYEDSPATPPRVAIHQSPSFLTSSIPTWHVTPSPTKYNSERWQPPMPRTNVRESSEEANNTEREDAAIQAMLSLKTAPPPVQSRRVPQPVPPAHYGPWHRYAPPPAARMPVPRHRHHHPYRPMYTHSANYSTPHQHQHQQRPQINMRPSYGYHAPMYKGYMHPPPHY